jgi:hypothetical protein
MSEGRGPRYISDDLREAAEALLVLRADERVGYLLSAAAEELDRLKLAVESPPSAPRGFKWQLMPDYPIGEVIGPCVCGSWPGGKCLKCPVQSP